MSTHDHTKPFPKGPLYAAFVLVLGTLALATWGRYFAPEQDLRAGLSPLETRDVLFIDEPQGVVHVVDADTGELIHAFAAGDGGFLRATVRGLARERRRYNEGADAPFEITRWDNGGVSLDDPSTGATIQLEAFGVTNARIFARFLKSWHDPEEIGLTKG